MTKDDERWHEDRVRYGWKLYPAPWYKRLPVIRFVRFVLHHNRVYSAAQAWGSCGIGFGLPNQRDVWTLYAIRRGWA